MNLLFFSQHQIIKETRSFIAVLAHSKHGGKTLVQKGFRDIPGVASNEGAHSSFFLHLAMHDRATDLLLEPFRGRAHVFDGDLDLCGCRGELTYTLHSVTLLPMRRDRRNSLASPL